MYFCLCVLKSKSLLLTITHVAVAQQVTDYSLANISGQETFIRNSAPNNSFNTVPYMLIGGWGDYTYGLMKWNMTTLPVLSQGDKAELMLYNIKFAVPSTPTQVTYSMIASPWQETLTWNTASLYWYSTIGKTVDIASYGNWSSLDITNFYSYWKAGTPNNGLLFVPVNVANNFNYFASVENGNASYRPFLRVTKAPPSTQFLSFPLDCTSPSCAVRYSNGAYTAGKINAIRIQS